MGPGRGGARAVPARGSPGGRGRLWRSHTGEVDAEGGRSWNPPPGVVGCQALVMRCHLPVPLWVARCGLQASHLEVLADLDGDALPVGGREVGLVDAVGPVMAKVRVFGLGATERSCCSRVSAHMPAAARHATTPVMNDACTQSAADPGSSMLFCSFLAASSDTLRVLSRPEPLGQERRSQGLVRPPQEQLKRSVRMSGPSLDGGSVAYLTWCCMAPRNALLWWSAWQPTAQLDRASVDWPTGR